MLQFLEGFESYGNSAMDGWVKWDSPITFNIFPGRFSGESITLPNYIPKFFPPVTGITIGFAINVVDLASNLNILQLTDSFQNQVMFVGKYYYSNLVYVQNKDQSITLTTSRQMPCNTWVYFEISILDAGSTAAGNILIRMNGELILSSPSGFSITFGQNNVTGFQLFSSGNPVYYDDVYVVNTNGGINQTFMGDGVVETLFPNAPGDLTQFSVFGAAANWQAVSESPPDDDTTYVYDPVLNDMDLYQVSDISTVAQTIPGIAITTLSRIDQASTVTADSIIKSSGNITPSGDTQFMGATYHAYQGIYEQEPVTNIAWTPTLINNLQIGTEVT